MDTLGVLVAAGASTLVGWAAMRLGPRLGLVDRPDGEGLKPHQGEVAPLGGLGILVGVQLGLAVTGDADAALLMATLLIFAIGLVDDAVGLSPFTRLLGALLAGGLLAGLGGAASAWEVIGTALLVGVVVNAVNLSDGLDLLAGSVTALAALAIGVLGVIVGSGTGPAMITVAGAILGFLIWNRPPARLFMGDNGAYVIGLTLVWGIWGVGEVPAVGAVALALVGVPLFELGVTVVRRSRAGSEWFAGDRDHTYDLLHAAGASVRRVALVFGLAQSAWAVMVLTVMAWAGADIAALTATVGGVVLVLVFGLRAGRPG